MSKIVFDDHSYIETIKSEDKIIIAIAAADSDKPLSMIVNSVELTKDQFNIIIKELTVNN